MTIVGTRNFLAALSAVILMAGCTYLPEYMDPIDWIDSANEWVTGGNNESDEMTALGSEKVPGEEDPFPSLDSVPDDRPSIRTLREREAIANALVADRDNARYDETDVPKSSETIQVETSGTLEQLDAGESRSIEQYNRKNEIQVLAEARDQEVIGEREREFVIPPPVPSVPHWDSIEDSFDEMFRASGGAGSLATHGASLHGSSNYEMAATGSFLEPDQFRVHAAVIYFSHGSSKLSNADKKVLQEVAAAVVNGRGHVSVIGHASSRTKTNDILKHNIVNYETSLARAKAVAAELVRQGIPTERVSIYAMADGQPDYSEATKLGEAGNRRANVYVDF